MPEPLKDILNPAFVSELAASIQATYAEFDAGGFQNDVLTLEWKNRELKDRIGHISTVLNKYLPGDFEQSIEILKPASLHFGGLGHMVFPTYVELFGLGDFDVSMSALAFFTQKSTAEFAIRAFITKFTDRTMKQMGEWAQSDNNHIRRLASEGCRPRLPWAMALPEFKKKPDPVLAILKKLKSDKSLYVRRSVANNLNDISKDHPDVIIKLARSWLGDNPDTDWLVKHACRTLLKKGRPEVMALFGFTKPEHIKIAKFKVDEFVIIGDRLGFSFELSSIKKDLGRLRIEYAVDFVKNNGCRSRKVFKISESENAQRHRHIKRAHSFRVISTRKYYQGVHGLAIIINGYELDSSEFRLDL